MLLLIFSQHNETIPNFVNKLYVYVGFFLQKIAFFHKYHSFLIKKFQLVVF